MINSWNGRQNSKELEHLKGDRHYIIFVPNPDDETNYSVLVADTCASDLSEQSYDEESFNGSNIIVKGIMDMWGSELE